MHPVRFFLFLAIVFPTLIWSEDSKANSWPIFAFQNGMRTYSPAERIDLLGKLGFDGIGSASPAGLTERLPMYDEAGLKIFSLYLGLEAFPDRYQLNPSIPDAIEELKGRGSDAVIELFVRGPKGGAAVREQAIAGVREVARLAEQSGLRVVLYPHAGFHVDTVGGAYELALAVDRPNVGVMFNLCHFLKVEPGSNLRDVLTRVKPLLWRVSTSGAKLGGVNWGELIMPLDAGTFSQADFLSLLKELEYDGPVGLQCYGIREPSAEHLGRSISAWKILTR